MAITQDGYASGAGGGSQTGGSVTLSTTNAGDIIVLCVYSEDNGHAGGPLVVNAVSSTHTTGWTKRASTTSPDNVQNGAGAALDVWYGVASAPLTGEVISFTFSGTVDDWGAVCSGWSGVDQATPWDTNVAIPASNTSNAGTTDPSVTGVSTSANNTVVLAFAGSTGNGNFSNPSSAPSGFSGQGTPGSTGGGRLFAECYGAYQAQTAPQSGITVAFTTAVSGWISIVDALRAAGQAVITKSSAALIGF